MGWLLNDGKYLNDGLFLDDPGPPSPPITVGEEIRNASWNQLGIPYNPEAAFAVYARRHGLGNPVTREFDLVVAPQPPSLGEQYRAQGYAGGIVWCAVGDWGNVQVLDW